MKSYEIKDTVIPQFELLNYVPENFNPEDIYVIENSTLNCEKALLGIQYKSDKIQICMLGFRNGNIKYFEGNFDGLINKIDDITSPFFTGFDEDIQSDFSFLSGEFKNFPHKNLNELCNHLKQKYGNQCTDIGDYPRALEEEFDRISGKLSMILKKGK